MMANRRIYLDNAATSFPKPPAVLDSMIQFANDLGASPGRGAYAEARQAGRLLLECRTRICQLIGADTALPEHIIFTLNTTDALNLAIRGILTPHLGNANTQPVHIITTWLDHNSVLRPFNMMARQWGVEQSRIQCDPQTGLVDPDDIRSAIRPETRLIAVIHGSNVTGSLQPIDRIGRIARENGIPFLVDAAQTAGHFPIDVDRDCIDLLAFPGHKGLLGPLGTGGLYIRPGIEKYMATCREGGTGSVSDSDQQPDFLPDRFEPGSHNAIGIIGLSQGVQWILDRTVESLWSHERKLIDQMLDGLLDSNAMPGLTLYGPQSADHRCGVFAIRIEGFDHPQSLSDLLEQQYGILTRSGIHCAPLAHKTFGTDRLAGSTRLSIGPFITEDDISYTCQSLGRICRQHAQAVV